MAWFTLAFCALWLGVMGRVARSQQDEPPAVTPPPTRSPAAAPSRAAATAPYRALTGPPDAGARRRHGMPTTEGGWALAVVVGVPWLLLLWLGFAATVWGAGQPELYGWMAVSWLGLAGPPLLSTVRRLPLAAGLGLGCLGGPLAFAWGAAFLH